VTLPATAKARGALGLRDTGGAVEWMNLYAREWLVRFRPPINQGRQNLTAAPAVARRLP